MNRRWREFTVLMIPLAIFSLLIACGAQSPPKDEKIENVVRIFMYDQYHWSLMVQLPSSNESKLLGLIYVKEVRFIADVPSERMMWVLIKKNKASFTLADQAFFHVHSPADINGARWNHGKGGHGETVVVE